MHGELTVLVLSDVADRFAEGAELRLEDGRVLKVVEARPHKDRLLVRFEGIADRTQAEALQTSLLVVPVSASPELPEGSWWDHQIEGCALRTDTGRSLGTVREVIHTSANDVWAAADDAGVETLIPVLKDVVVNVDVDGRRIVVREIPGLTTPE